jgi:plastocyanin
MSTGRRAAAVAAVLLIGLLLPGSFSRVAAEGGPQTLSLYGGLEGWGFTSDSVDDPGPNITAYAGYPLTLMLISVDDPRLPHDWFISYDGDNQEDPGEPGSRNFQGPDPTPFSFIPDRVGNWTYRCSFHPTDMRGTIRILPQTNVTLYGDQDFGWGLSDTSTRSPGPGLAFVSQTNVTFQLISNDSENHNFFIDYNGDGLPSAGEPKTVDFITASPVTDTISLDRAGNYSYRCQYHAKMHGNVVILGPPGPGGGFNVALIPGILIATLGGVLVFAAVYHVRAVRAARRRK